jgi:hypothetical protein
MSRLPLVGFCVALATLGWFYFQGPVPEPPVSCTLEQLADHPVTYAGKLVRVPTAGTEPSAGGLVWWRFLGEPPRVRLTGRFDPHRPPAHLTGRCHAPLAGGPVTVRECRSSP